MRNWTDREREVIIERMADAARPCLGDAHELAERLLKVVEETPYTIVHPTELARSLERSP